MGAAGRLRGSRPAGAEPPPTDADDGWSCCSCAAGAHAGVADRARAARRRRPENRRDRPRVPRAGEDDGATDQPGEAAGQGIEPAVQAAEAIRLARMMHRLLPDQGEVAGLLALMLLTDARRAARTAADGALTPLAEQDRSQWDRAQIAEP
jgi:hypothetical protein